MLIAVNTRFLIRNQLEGIGWFTYESMKRLVLKHPEHTFLFLFDRPGYEEFVFAKNVIPVKVWPPARHPYLWQIWFDRSLPYVFKKYKPDLFISTDGFLSLKTHVPTVLVIHDLGFEQYPEHTPGNVSRYYRRFTPQYARRAKRILTVSQYTRNDIVSRYKIDPSKIDVIYNGANENYIPMNETEKLSARKKYAGGSSFFVYVGSIHPRKNIKNMLLAYDLFRDSHPGGEKLLIAGRFAWKTNETRSVYEQMRHKEDVIFTGHLHLPELTRIVGSADAMIYPSFFEGFGIPVLEARYCGIPVISSDRSSLPEVAGEKALYFNPDDVGEMSRALHKFVSNKQEITRQFADVAAVREKFNWDKTVERMERAIQKTDPRFLANREELKLVKAV